MKNKFHFNTEPAPDGHQGRSNYSWIPTIKSNADGETVGPVQCIFRQRNVFSSKNIFRDNIFRSGLIYYRDLEE